MEAAKPALEKMVEDADNDDYKDRATVGVTDLRDAKMPSADVIAKGMSYAGGIPEDDHDRIGKAGVILPDNTVGHVLGGLVKAIAPIAGADGVEVFHNSEDAVDWVKKERDEMTEKKKAEHKDEDTTQEAPTEAPSNSWWPF